MTLLSAAVLLLLGFAGEGRGLPQRYGGGLEHIEVSAPHPTAPTVPSGCRIEYITKYDVVYEQNNQKLCETNYETKCSTRYKNSCKPYYDKECDIEQVRECETLLKEECKHEYREVPEHYTEDVCKNEHVRICKKKWVTIGYNDKVWKEDPNDCQELVETKCAPVQLTRTRREGFNKCEKVPYQDCRNRPIEKCHKVQKEKCEKVPYQDCNKVPKQVCRNDHSKVPKQVSRREPVQVCDGAGSNHYQNSHQGPAGLVDAGAVVVGPRADGGLPSTDGVIF